MEEQVGRALEVLNEDLECCKRVAANQWLVDFQHSHAAWDVSTAILTSPSPHPFHLQLFAAQILKRKIQREGMNLQPEARNALQSALLISAKKFSAGPQQLLTQICVALSALVLREVEVTNPIEQLFGSMYELQGDGTGNNAILELLTVLPEEVIEDQFVNVTVSASRRWQLSQELLSHTAAVLDFLLQLTEDETVKSSLLYDRHRKILRCLLSWVRIGCFLEIPQSCISTHPILAFVFSSLQASSSFDLAVEVLTEVVGSIEMMPEVLLSRVQSFKDGLLLPALISRNEMVISGLACLMAELGQAAPALIAKASPESFILTDILLRCISYPSCDWEIADSTLNFWCTLAEHVLERSAQGERLLRATFFPIFTSVLDALISRAEVNPLDYTTVDLDVRSTLSSTLAYFRRNLEELLAEICRLLGPSQYVTKLFSGTWISLEPPIPWQVVEVRLFALHTVADSVLQGGETFDLSIILRVIIAVLNCSPDITTKLMHLVYKSTADVVGSYSKLLCPHTKAVLPIFSFLASGLSIPAAASSCATALRRICEDVLCIANEPANLEALLWIGEGLQNLPLSLHEEEEVISAIGNVLYVVNNKEILEKSLERLLQHSYDGISSLLSTNVEGSFKPHSATYAATLECCIRALTRLGAILSQFSSLAPNQKAEQPIFNTLRHFWPLISRLLSSCHMENRCLASATCKSLSHIVRASGQQFGVLLPEVMSGLSKNFQYFQSHECFIRTAAIALEEFGQEVHHATLFISTFKAFTEAEVIFAMNSAYACDQEPEVVEAYMNFTSTFLHCCPEEVVVAAGLLIEQSLRKATVWCTAMHRGAALAALSFISCVLDAALSSVLKSETCDINSSLTSKTLKIISQCGENTVSGVFYALLGISAMTRVHKAAVILQQLATLCYICERENRKTDISWKSLEKWIAYTVQSIPKEYLRAGESEQVVSTWLKTMEGAASDYLKNYNKDGHMQGDTSRSLKRMLRQFADMHRQLVPFTSFPDLSNSYV